MMHRRVCALALALVVVLLVPHDSPAARSMADVAREWTVGLDYDLARAVLRAMDPDDPSVALERARLAIYELDCDGAAVILARPELQKNEGEQLGDIARGCQRVTAALSTDVDTSRQIEIRWQDEHDRPLGPLLFDTVAKARDTLVRDLGVDWPAPTRIVVVRDLLSLSAMTGLPYDSARTTGTVAVAKWGRVTILSPRASVHGYPWRDTVAHELTHLAVTRASRDRAPLWLQEGIAKREEVRWRAPGPFDDRPTPEAIVQRGLEMGLGTPIDKLGPSIAMLPSADAAMVAFAEVTSFVRFFADARPEPQAGPKPNDSLRRLLAALKDGEDPNAAAVAATGVDLKTWDARWISYVNSRPHEGLGGLLGGDRGSHAPELRDLRDRTRLASLLLSRSSSNAAAALEELNHVQASAATFAPDVAALVAGDPSSRWIRARAMEEAGRVSEAQPLVADPRQVLASYGPWWATRGRWAQLRGDVAESSASFVQAVSDDPFYPEASCETLDLQAPVQDPSKRGLCEAARARGEPPFGGD